MFRFPWSNFHELNLDWILEVVKEAKEIFINGEGDIQHAVETSEQALEVAEQAAAAVITDGSITIPKLNNEVLKTTAYVIVGNRADEPIPAGAYVYLRKSLVYGLPDGIYTAAVNIPADAIVTPAEFQQSIELHDAGALNVLKTAISAETAARGAADTVIETDVNQLNRAMAIIINGNTAAVPVSKGEFVYVKNSTITGVTDGLYSSNTMKTAGVAFVSSELTAISDGGFSELTKEYRDEYVMQYAYSSDQKLEAKKKGNVVMVKVGTIASNIPTRQNVPIATLDSKYYPSSPVASYQVNSTGGEKFSVTISTNGIVSIYVYENTLTYALLGNWFLTYIV